MKKSQHLAEMRCSTYNGEHAVSGLQVWAQLLSVSVADPELACPGIIHSPSSPAIAPSPSILPTELRRTITNANNDDRNSFHNTGKVLLNESPSRYELSSEASISDSFIWRHCRYSVRANPSISSMAITTSHASFTCSIVCPMSRARGPREDKRGLVNIASTC